MSLMDILQTYIDNLNCIKSYNTNVGVNFLDGNIDSFSIEEIPCEPLIKRYVDGSSIRQLQFALISRFDYTEEIAQQLKNSNFYEELIDEIEDKNINGDLPLFEGNIEAQNIEVYSTPYLVYAEEGSATYQVNLRLKYLKKR